MPSILSSAIPDDSLLIKMGGLEGKHKGSKSVRLEEKVKARARGTCNIEFTLNLIEDLRRPIMLE